MSDNNISNQQLMKAAIVAAENPEVVSAANQALRHTNQASEKAGGMTVLAGAGAAGAAAGLMVGGPVIGVVGAGAAAYAATRSDQVGDAARAVGTGTVTVAKKAAAFNEEHKVTEKVQAAVAGAVSKACEFEQEHHVTQKISTIAVGTYEKAKALNEEHHIAERAAAAASGAYNKAVEVNQKYQITTKLADGFVKGLNKLADAVDKKPTASISELPSAPPASDSSR